MTESDYLEQLLAVWPTLPNPSQMTMADVPSIQPQVKIALDLAETAMQTFPDSAALWCRRGELLLLSEDQDCAAEECFERAIQAEPRDPEGYRLMGDYYDNSRDDPRSAEPWYRKSIELGGDELAYFGLAQTLAELNKIDEARSLLSPPRFPFPISSEVIALDAEIREGLWSPVS